MSVLIPSEDYEQMMLVQWFRRTHKDVRIFAIPNGGYRTTAGAAKMKATGVSAGVPDLYVPEWNLWIEMKRQKGGTVSAVQKDWLAYLASIGDRCIVAKGCADAIAQISA